MACGSSTTVLDVKFNVGLPPDEARKYLTHRENWRAIIPGVADGTIDDGAAGAWTIRSGSFSFF
jgi:hypothetical protein